MLLVMGVACFVLASSSRSIHSHRRHSCWQKLMVKEEGCRRQMMYMSDFPKAPGCLCCCLMLRMDLNSDLMPVSSKTSRTAVSPRQREQFFQYIQEHTLFKPFDPRINIFSSAQQAFQNAQLVCLSTQGQANFLVPEQN